MLAAVDLLKEMGRSFDTWPDALKEAFGWAMIDPDKTLTPKEIPRAQEFAARRGWLDEGFAGRRDEGFAGLPEKDQPK